jgi:phosphoribosylaminoimidazole-succinocarboxamide synthase
VKNHVIAVPDPNVTIAKETTPIPIEMIVRGYITGVTGTSIWGSYEKGERIIYGIKFPNGLKKNQKLPKPIITPTTKAVSGHDERLTRQKIIQQKIVPEKIYRQMEKISLALFERGTKICANSGLILVDTKYEFGLDEKGNLLLIDEIHTPDSSRFWIKKTYKERFAKSLEPENFDKEFLRIWYKNHGYTGDGKPPPMPSSLAAKVSKLYKNVYRLLTGKSLAPIDGNLSLEKRIQKNLENLNLHLKD